MIAKSTLQLLLLLLFIVCVPHLAFSDELRGFSAYSRPDPFGGIVAPDQNGAEKVGATSIALLAVRGAYASFHLTVNQLDANEYDLSLEFSDPNKQIKIDLFREWFHFNDADAKYYPDALIPIANPYQATLPDPANGIKGQTAQSFWVDLWVPSDAKPGLYRGQAVLKSKRTRSVLQIELRVLRAVSPEEDALTIDHNSYGSSWLAELYPKLKQEEGPNFFASDAFFKLIHAYHQIFYEHHGTFHQLGYGHSGKVGPQFAPTLKGTGQGKHVEDWVNFDRHYGPLLDGSAFAATRRGPKPIPYVYLPVNPEWPASFLWWGEPGYEAEFVNVLGEMEKHFRQKNWTRTQFELFFNHKKRYKGFPWDADEARVDKDDSFAFEYARLLKQAVPAQSPVKFVMRADVSWRTEDQFQKLSGVIGLWATSKDTLSWLPDSVKTVKGRGDTVWIYGGTPAINASSAAMLEDPLRAWIWKVDGYVRWLAVSPSPDPWFHSNGEDTCLAYPGERFGLSGPISSIRLKIQRNFLQDINLLKLLEKSHSPDELRQEVTKRLNVPQPKDWWVPRPPMANTPPEEWNNYDIEQHSLSASLAKQKLRLEKWEQVRPYILKMAEGEIEKR